jgi:hypothetical protein
MRLVAIGLLTWFLFLDICYAPAHADGGTISLSSQNSAYQITVFSAPTPFRAGPVDISVLVQDGQTGEPLTTARVTVRMSKPGQFVLDYPATTAAATNKLFHSAHFQLPEPGNWRIEVEVQGQRGQAVIGGQIAAASPLPRWLEMWPWFGWPALVVALFSLQKMLTRPRLVKPGRPRSHLPVIKHSNASNFSAK